MKKEIEESLLEDDEEEYGDEMIDMEVWIEDLRAKFTELEDKEILSPKDQAIFNESVMDVLASIIVNLRIVKEEFKMFENVYKLKDMTSLIGQFMGAVEESSEDSNDPSNKPGDSSLYA